MRTTRGVQILKWLLVPLLGCSGERALPEPARTWAAFRADTLWARGGIQDTVLETPLALVADGENVYVTDLASRRVAALAAGTGELQWVSGRRGAGPGEFERPAAIALLPERRLAVSDTRNSRILILTRRGEALSTFRVEDPEINGLCGMADGSVVGVSAREGPSIARWLPSGAESHRRDLPWPELADGSALERQVVMASTPDGSGCLIALVFGNGFAVLGTADSARVHEFVERVPKPVVEVETSGSVRRQQIRQSMISATFATRAVAAGDDRHYVAFTGSTEDQGRILDEYGPDGTYIHSHRLPAAPAAMTWGDGVLYLLTHLQGVPTLTALRIREDT